MATCYKWYHYSLVSIHITINIHPLQPINSQTDFPDTHEGFDHGSLKLYHLLHILVKIYYTAILLHCSIMNFY